MDALEHIHRVVVVGNGDVEHVNVVHEVVHDAVATLDIDDDLAAGRRQGIVANGLRGIGVVGRGVLNGGEGAARLTKGSE